MRIVEKIRIYFIGIYFQLENICSDIIYFGKLILKFRKNKSWYIKMSIKAYLVVSYKVK